MDDALLKSHSMRMLDGTLQTEVSTAAYAETARSCERRDANTTALAEQEDTSKQNRLM
jgi:hypothetical protein